MTPAIPALLTTTCSPPNASAAPATAVLTAAESVTSATAQVTAPPSACAPSRSSSATRPTRQTRAPSATKARAVAMPMLPSPPVMRAAFPRSKPLGSILDATRQLRYIECGVAILAYSRQRRGPGATRRSRIPPDGSRLSPCPGSGWPPGWPSPPCSAAGSRCSARTRCTGCGVPRPASPTRWPRSRSWPCPNATRTGTPPGLTSRWPSWSAGPSSSRCCGWCGPATASPRSGWWPTRPPR